jgi:hypothetical protein
MICRKMHMTRSICLRATIFQNPEGTLWTHCRIENTEWSDREQILTSNPTPDRYNSELFRVLCDNVFVILSGFRVYTDVYREKYGENFPT